MSAATIDRLLAVLVVAMATTGLLSLRAGNPDQGWVFLVHDVLAGALALTVAMKLGQSVPRAVAGRHFVRLAFGLVVSLVAVAALVGGYLSVAEGALVWVGAGSLGPWTVLTMHAWAGLILLPILVVHVLPRRWRLLRLPRPVSGRPVTGVPFSRRALIAGGAMAVAGFGMWLGSTTLERVAGGSRRFTGSRLLPAGSLPIATTFLGEPTPAVDEASWRVRVEGSVERPSQLDLSTLRGIGDQELRAVLDCTSGWAVDATWRGVPLAAVLDHAGALATARRVEIRSVTGWATSLAIEEARGALLAWSVAGGPLPVANGAPLRLVAPNHRGLDWVKWVGTIRVE